MPIPRERWELLGSDWQIRTVMVDLPIPRERRELLGSDWQIRIVAGGGFANPPRAWKF
ncbi:hypothetical protein QUF72_16375 [Desulfobacterales bacterium HSG2]|nr:hypothetical protein [Desulfobacterales bacterium HSG2]